MHTIKFSIEVNIFHINDKDLTTNNICEKSEQLFRKDDASVCHSPIYASVLDDSPVRQLPSKVLTD